jgi:molybdopterin molybdotransferase
VPPEDNSEMDGYALRVADVPTEGVVLPVSQRIAAGQVGQALQPGTAARIFTGAQIPPGADAVVMQELCEPAAPASDGRPGSVRVRTVPVAGMAIRRRGEDVQLGAVVLRPGARMTPQAMGMAASVGAATLQVWQRPRVALFSTGDELAMPGEPLKPGAIYNSNRFTLRGLLQAAGCTAIDLGIVPDRLDATRDALRRAAAGADLVLTCGGVSVGEEDHLKPALQAEGRLDLWSIAIKPGKPLAFGTVRRGDGSEALYIGLPGNPVSSTVTFLVAVMPVLRSLCGSPPLGPRPIAMTAGFDWPKPNSRREFLRARVAADGRLEIYPNQGSGVLTSMVWADGLIDNPPGRAIARGDSVQFLPLPMLLG